MWEGKNSYMCLIHTGFARLCKVEDQVEYFENRFAKLVQKACQDVRKRELEPSEFLSQVTTLRVSDRNQHRSFIEEKLTDIPPPVTFEKIWSRLTIYWDFLNYRLLEHVVRNFGNEDLKDQMQDYVDELSAFKKTTRLCDFINSWPCKDDRPPEEGLRKVVVKMHQEWTQCTLQDVESFKMALIHKLFLPEFELILQKAEEGCVCVTWLTSPSIATLLQQNLTNIETEFFTELKVKALTIDGQDCYPSPISGYLTEQSTSEQPTVSISPPMPTEKFYLMFKHESDEKETVMTSTFTKLKLLKSFFKGNEVSTVSASQHQQLGDPLQIPSTSGKLSRDIHATAITSTHSETSTDLLEEETVVKLKLIDKPTFQHGYFPSKFRPLGDPIRMTTTSGYHGMLQGERYSSKAAVSPITSPQAPTPKEYVKQKCVDEDSLHAKLLPSVEQYLSKADVEADPLLPTKYRDYLSSTPAIRAAMYTPFNAKTSAEVFAWSQFTESPPPTTMTELFTTFTLKTLVGYLSTHPLYHKQQLKVTSFSDLPPDVYKQFLSLCRMAYKGLWNRQQLVFTAAHLPTGFSPLGLMQEVPQVYTQGKASYHFTHLTLQEFLSAVHIAQLPSDKQAKVIQDHVDSGHFKMTTKFVAGLVNIPPEIIRKLREDDDNHVNLLHWLFECKNTSMNTRTLGSGEMEVRSHYSWTPLDYYVTGHVISHSNCPWRLDFSLSFIRSLSGVDRCSLSW